MGLALRFGEFRHGCYLLFPRNAVFLSPRGAGAPLLLPSSRRSDRREGGNRQNRRGITRPKGQVKRIRARARRSSSLILHKRERGRTGRPVFPVAGERPAADLSPSRRKLRGESRGHCMFP
ncbi:hypothetical protein SS05631_d65240 (plasmid) [Sinorhizobium sp. CCBAU 05631]|nr:hypothetical protein SS05631_d65240 [Sinorhizobium sp. CCBAU 05631]